MWAYGDSTSAGFAAGLAAGLSATPDATGTRAGQVTADPDNHGGWEVSLLAADVDAAVAERADNYRWAIISIGSNDFDSISDGAYQTQWKVDLAYVLDAIHTRWPLVQVYVCRPWRRDYMTAANTVAGLIDDVLSTRSSWAHLGTDARVWMEGGDNGYTYSVDGVHANDAGYALQAGLLQELMGY